MEQYRFATQRAASFNPKDMEHDDSSAGGTSSEALTYRCYDAAEYQIGIVVQDGNAEYEEITITK
jgi:hypothetical protein